MKANNQKIVRLLLKDRRAKFMLKIRDKEGRRPLDFICDETIHSLLLHADAGASVAGLLLCGEADASVARLLLSQALSEGPTASQAYPSNQVVPESAQSLPQTTSSARSAAVLA